MKRYPNGKYVSEVLQKSGNRLKYVTDILRVTLRSGPSTDDQILAVLESGRQVEVLDQEVGWSRVKTDEGMSGWIISRYLIESPSDRWCIEGQCFNGTGTYLNLSGIKYIGEFKNGLKHGTGTMLWPNGTTYTGTFQDGEIHGQGTMSYAGGSVVSGNFQNGNLVSAK